MQQLKHEVLSIYRSNTAIRYVVRKEDGEGSYVDTFPMSLIHANKFASYDRALTVMPLGRYE